MVLLGDGSNCEGKEGGRSCHTVVRTHTDVLWRRSFRWMEGPLHGIRGYGVLLLVFFDIKSARLRY